MFKQNAKGHMIFFVKVQMLKQNKEGYIDPRKKMKRRGRNLPFTSVTYPSNFNNESTMVRVIES